MIDTLFIDIDGTVTRPGDAEAHAPGDRLLGRRMLALMRDQAVAQRGMTATEAERIICDVHERETWWDWEDYVSALGLNPEGFWSVADAAERRWHPPREEGLAQVLTDLRDAGMQLVITSNNPASGIRQKLRLSGMSDAWQRLHLTQTLGTDRVHAMKWDAVYWQRALQIADKDPQQVAVIGDTWHDDVLMPREAGIARQLFFAVPGDARSMPDGVSFITRWAQVAELLAALPANLSAAQAPLH